MKRLVCEICGGTDIIKDGGVFVCESCGCKYTIEEVKKLMIEGTVQIEGTVVIDNTSKVENLLLNAKRAFEDSRYVQAQELYGQVLNEDPNNAMAILYEGLSIGWQGNTVRYTIDKARDATLRALDIAFSNNGGDDEFEVFALLTVAEMEKLGTALISLCVKYQVDALQRYKNTLDELTYRSNRMDVVYGDFEGLQRELKFAENNQNEKVREQELILKRTLNLMLDVFRKSISFCKAGYCFKDQTLV